MRGTLLLVTCLVVSAYSNPVDEKKGCTTSSDCPNNFHCNKSECVDPCTDGICGSGALCRFHEGYPLCSCPKGFDGNPFIECRPEEDSKVTVKKLPSVTPCHHCGLNTTCTIRTEIFVVCTCLEGMTGDPFDFCVPLTADDDVGGQAERTQKGDGLPTVNTLLGDYDMAI